MSDGTTWGIGMMRMVMKMMVLMSHDTTWNLAKSVLLLNNIAI